MPEATRPFKPKPVKVYDVVSLLFRNPNRKALLAQRAFKRARHPGVLGPVTMLLESGEEAQLHNPSHTRLGRTGPQTEAGFVLELPDDPRHQLSERSDPVTGLVRKVVRRKLGPLKDFDRFSGTAAVRLVKVMDVDDKLGTDGATQRTRMITVEINLDGFWEPRANRRYHECLVWSDPELYQAAYRSNDGHLILPNADPVRLCMDGACNSSAYHVLTMS